MVKAKALLGKLVEHPVLALLGGAGIFFAGQFVASVASSLGGLAIGAAALAGWAAYKSNDPSLKKFAGVMALTAGGLAAAAFAAHVISVGGIACSTIGGGKVLLDGARSVRRRYLGRSTPASEASPLPSMEVLHVG